MSDHLLNYTEAGKRLGCSRTTVADRVEAGLIPAVVCPRTGRKLVSESAIVNYRASFSVYEPPKTQPSQTSQGSRE